MDGHGGKELFDGPVIGHGLEDAEIGDEFVRQALVEILELLRDVFQALMGEDAAELPADFPEEDLALGAVFETQVTQVEQREKLVLLGDGVVVHLAEILHGDVVARVGQLFQDLRFLAGEFHFVFGVGGVNEADDVHHHHLVVGHDGAPRLTQQVWHGHLLTGADVLRRVDDVRGVLLDGVVHAGTEGGFRTIVIHAETPAHVEVADGDTHLAELRVNARGLLHGGLHAADVGDLRANVEVQFLNALQHSALLQGLHGFQDFPGGEAEFRVVAGAGFPLAFAHGVELGA